MCGIAGFIDFNKKSSEEVLNRMSASLHHRGPDAGGTVFLEERDAQLGIGHRRLSIIDISEGGKQPMKRAYLTITFNGEIYNYAEIKKELEALGHSFKSHSDTEVILMAYAQWGEKCLEKFIGMFAFVIHDKKNEEFFCARDRAGVKPFFYYWKDGLFMFASELKAFHQHPEFRKEIDHDALGAFMQFGNVPTPYCIFKNCQKIKPGYFLRISLPQKKLSKVRYWNVYDAYNQPKLNLPFEEAKKETEKILKSAFSYRLVSDVPLGLFLSGGYDSTCLAALLQKERSEKLKTFTIGVEDAGLDEAPFAKKIAAYLGTDHQEYYCSQKDVLELIPSLPFFYDEPFADQSALPTTLVSKIARKQVTVALSADGGDEVFAGYNRYDYLIRYGNLLRKMPSPVRSALGAMMNALPADKLLLLNKKYNFHNRYEKLKSLLEDPSPRNMMLSLSRQFRSEQLNDLLIKKPRELKTAYASEELKKENWTSLAYMMAIDYQTYLVDDILQKVDRASMSVSLEAREPFLDHRLIEWAARLPDHYKYHKGEKKYILKQIVNDYVPSQLMNRPKMGFAIPIEKWLLSDLKEQVEYYLDEKTIKDEGIFNAQEVTKLVKAFYSGKKELAQKIWFLLMFEMWYEKWGR